MLTENRAPKQTTFEQLTLYFSVSICVEPKTVFYYLGVTQDLWLITYQVDILSILGICMITVEFVLSAQINKLISL